MQRRFMELVQAEKHRGATILLSSHLLGEVEGACDRALFVREGHLVAEQQACGLEIDPVLMHLYGAEKVGLTWDDVRSNA